MDLFIPIFFGFFSLIKVASAFHWSGCVSLSQTLAKRVPTAYLAMAKVSNGFLSPGLYITKIVVLLADCHVDGSIVFKIGSSLYSRPMISHISMPDFSINFGSTVAIRSLSHLSIITERSFISSVLGI